MICEAIRVLSVDLMSKEEDLTSRVELCYSNETLPRWKVCAALPYPQRELRV